MHTKLQNLRFLDARQILAIAAVVLLFCAMLFGLLIDSRAQAATASTINFQARLMNTEGSIAADGDYNIEFKLYDTESTGGTAQGVCTGNCKWVETRTGTDVVTVVNGYITVNLGSVDVFGAGINWNQDLWMTMNIGGTGTPSWDGEMTPRLKLTAVPYAFQAGQLSSLAGSYTGTLQFAGSFGQDSTITLPDPEAATATVCYQGASGCGFVEGSSADFIQNQSSSQQATSSFWISGTGRADVALQSALFDTPTAVALDIGTTNATQINLNKDTFLAANQDLTLQGSSAYISNPQASVGSAEAFGLNAAVDGNGTAIGNSATAGTGGASGAPVAVGFQATALSWGVAVGGQSSTTGDEGTAVGEGSIAHSQGVALGANATTAGDTGSIAIGFGASTTASNQLVIGSNNFGINHAVLGSGVTDASPTNFTLQGTSGNGTDIAGADVTIAGGQSTGNAFGGSVLIQVSAAGGSSGTSANSLSTVATFGGATGAALFQNASDSTQAFRVQDAGDDNLFVIDTQNSRVGINMTGSGVPALTGAGLEVSGALRLSSSVVDTFTTPVSSSVSTKINIPIYDPGSFGQILALGMGDVADRSTSRVLSLFDARSYAHQPTLAVFSPNENDIGGFSWDGSNSAFLVKNTNASGSIGLNVGGSTYLSVTNAGAAITGTLSVSSLGTADTGAHICRNSSNQLATCTDSGSSYFVQGGNDFDAPAVLGTNDADNLQFETNNVVRATFDTSDTLYLGNGATAAAPNDFTVSGTGSSTTAVAGGNLTLQGGDATVGDASGGDLLLTGGSGFGTGVNGLVVINTPTFTTSSTQICDGSSNPCIVDQDSVDSRGVISISVTAIGVTVELPDPTNSTAGRLIYVTAANGVSEDFTLSVNSGGTGNEVAMRQNTSATMIWNGTDWTAAGASSSTTLQAAYDNTLSSAGGAEIILNNTATSNGLTVRNNPTSPISGGLLEVQTSIGTNLFSVNNNISELVTNGGAEDNPSFGTDWTALGTSTVTRTTTSGQYATGAAGVSVAAGTTAGNGVRNNLSGNPVTSTTYMISFTAMLDSGAPAFTDLQVDYTPTGASTGTQCIASETLVSTNWTRVTCEIVTPGTAVTDPDILIYQVAAPGSARTFYVDNLSMTLADDAGGIPNNVQIGGGIYGGSPTLFTLDRSSAAPVANNNETYLGSMYYDTTSGRIQCYEADGWGACGSAPNNIVVLTPEYSGAVLNGTGIGTLSADFCANSAALTVGSLCASGISRNFYAWTSPQASMQTYSIYVSYKLPDTFKEFDSANTITLTWMTTSASGTDGYVSYQVFKSTGSAITSCDGTDETTVATPSADTWYTTPFDGDETACDFSGGDNIIFKINVKARSNESVYVENLNFTYGNT